MVNFPFWIPDCDSPTVLLFWIDLFLLTLVFVLQWLSFLLEILVMLMSQFPLTFHQIHNSKNIFKLRASAAASEFCEWVQVGIDLYISHCKYQVNPHSFPWFSAACAAAIVHSNQFFPLYQNNKSSESKVKFWLVIIAKGFLMVPILHLLIKKESITSQ